VFFIFSSQTKAHYSEANIRAPALICGGYTEATLKLNGVVPYRSQALVHVSDLHATIKGLATASTSTLSTSRSTSTVLPQDEKSMEFPSMSKPAMSSVLGGGGIDMTGVDQWEFMIHQGGNNHQDNIQDPPRNAILYAKRAYQVKRSFPSFC
jgi:hypothetical protein